MVPIMNDKVEGQYINYEFNYEFSYEIITFNYNFFFAVNYKLLLIACISDTKGQNSNLLVNKLLHVRILSYLISYIYIIDDIF